MKIPVYNQAGEATSEVDLNPKIFSVEKIDPNLVYFAVRAQRNNARVAIAHTKNRGEVVGSGRKPWKQKGTGRARAGSIRSPLWKGGGVTFGPRSNRNFSIKLNRSMFRKALFTILSDKVRDNKLIILDDFKSTPKTGEFAKNITALAAKTGLGKKYAIILPSIDKNIERAAANLQNVKILQATRLNVVDLLNYDTVILKDALPAIEKTYLR